MTSGLEHADPMARFAEVFARAAEQAPFDHTAASLATATPDGVPSVRTVLVRHADERGFAFFTNYESRKGRELTANPAAALGFYWPWLDEQVLAEGTVTRLDDAASDAYFASRPRGSQVGAWVSRQSQPLAAREELESRWQALQVEYEGRSVPRPPNWGGFRLSPRRVEFWRAGEFRLHHRHQYNLGPGGWTVTTLYP